MSYYFKSSVLISSPSESSTRLGHERQMIAEPTATGVLLSLKSVMVDETGKDFDSANEKEYTLLWDEMADVEHLAMVFRAERVDVFREIVKILGKMHANREVVKALI